MARMAWAEMKDAQGEIDIYRSALLHVESGEPIDTSSSRFDGPWAALKRKKRN